ncbi:HDOD domain-containing protein [Engelhardtia mirabilis]
MLPIPDDFGADASAEQISEILVHGLGSGEIEVPVLNQSVVRLLELCREEDYRVEAVVGIVSRDPALAARILRVSNSAAYAPTIAIETVGQAVTRLGARALSEIALALMLKNQVFRASSRHSEMVRRLWLHSAIAGIYAKNIAILRGGLAESGMLEGLLHDVGRPVVIQLLGDVEKTIGENLPADVFHSVVDELHCDIGALLVREWGLPGHLDTAVALHHRPFAISDHRDAAVVAHLADELAHWAADPQSRDESKLRGHLAVRHLGFSAADLESLFAEPERVCELAVCF